jgi:hypothetical protein
MTAEKGGQKRFPGFYLKLLYGNKGEENNTYNGRIQVESLRRRIFTTEYCCPLDSLEFHGGIRIFYDGISSLLIICDYLYTAGFFSINSRAGSVMIA